MNHARTAILLRRLARFGLVKRRDLHRLARMPADRQREQACEAILFAKGDLRAAGECVGDMLRHPDIVYPSDVARWLGSAATWLVAAGILAIADADSVADKARSAQNEGI